jgi:hypothetical protein
MAASDKQVILELAQKDGEYATLYKQLGLPELR